MKLQPCPFCGSKDVACVEQNKGFHFTVWCETCGAEGPDDNRDAKAAISRWNDRRTSKLQHGRPTINEVQLLGALLTPTMPRQECEKFFDFFESNGWRVGRNPMKDWRAAMRNWHRRWMETRVEQRGGKHAPTTEARVAKILNQTGLGI